MGLDLLAFLSDFLSEINPSNSMVYLHILAMKTRFRFSMIGRRSWKSFILWPRVTKLSFLYICVYICFHVGISR